MRNITDVNKLARALGGVPVLGCIPGSPSHRAGVRYGDIVLQTNGQRTQDLDAYLRARTLDREVMTLVVFRDGNEETFTLDLSHYRASQEEIRSFVEENESLVTLSVQPSSAGQGTESC